MFFIVIVNHCFACIIGINLLKECFGEMSEIIVRNFSELLRKIVSENLPSEIKRSKFFASNVLAHFDTRLDE